MYVLYDEGIIHTRCQEINQLGQFSSSIFVYDMYTSWNKPMNEWIFCKKRTKIWNAQYRYSIWSNRMLNKLFVKQKKWLAPLNMDWLGNVRLMRCEIWWYTCSWFVKKVYFWPCDMFLLQIVNGCVCHFSINSCSVTNINSEKTSVKKKTIM